MNDTVTNGKPKRLKYFLLIIAVIALILILPGFWCGLTVRYYQYESSKISGNVRIALVTDLHSCYFGKGEKDLLESLYKQNPDLILLCGDIFDDALPDDNTEMFISGIADRYPCYYVTGNHEYRVTVASFLAKMAILDRYGVKRLRGETTEVHIKENTLILCGVDDPECIFLKDEIKDEPYKTLVDQLTDIRENITDDQLTILMSHRPEFFDIYENMDFELVLSGHAHGGQWRIPGILNGLYSPNQGLFPKYAGGVYHRDTTTMIVSRGLARESTPAPRFYNPPEYVIIDINGKT